MIEYRIHSKDKVYKVTCSSLNNAIKILYRKLGIVKIDYIESKYLDNNNVSHLELIPDNYLEKIVLRNVRKCLRRKNITI